MQDFRLQSADIEFPKVLTIPQALDAAAESCPSRDALIANGKRITFSDLRLQSRQVARALVAAGIRSGDHVALCAGNSVEWAVIFHGIVRAGAVCVPINTRLTAAEIQLQLERSDAVMLLTIEKLLKIDFVGLLGEICSTVDTKLPSPELPRLSQIVVLGDNVPSACQSWSDFVTGSDSASLPPLPQSDDTALIQFTSGSTSFPKAVLLTHANMTADAHFLGHRMGVRPTDRYLSARPFFHVAGSTLAVVLSVVHAVTLVTLYRFTGEDALRLIEEEACTLTSGNDTMYLMMLNSPAFKPGTYSLRGGWAAAGPEIMRRTLSEFGASETITGYGQSEASPNILASDYRDPMEDRIEGWMRPHPRLEVIICDPESGAILSPGEKGEIRVRGWCVMKGYYRDSEATAQTITHDGFLKTGDMGIMREDGRIMFVGRLKEIIRVGGENVAPADVENVLIKNPKVLQAQVFALPDPRLIEVPGAYIVPVEGQQLTAEEIMDWAKPRLAGFKLPKHIAIIESFDIIGLTASAKIPKRRLIEHAIKHFGLQSTGAGS